MKNKIFGKNLFFIAEIGVNHEGDLKLAKKLIKLAKNAGADAAKFQSYKANKIAAKNSPAYWDTSKESTKSQYKLFKKYDSFGPSEYKELYNYCDKIGIEFMSTPFDEEAADFLNPLQRFIKVASADITNFPLLKKISSYNKPIILSTGCSEIEEIKNAVNFLKQNNAKEIVLLHCILNYPTENKNANLGMICSLQNQFPECHIGYSDHTLPTSEMEVLVTSYILGARVIEKHFTYNKNLIGNDHYHSMDKNDLINFKNKIKIIDKILGSFQKTPLKSELKSIKFARRSLYYKNNLKKGYKIKIKDIIPLRPGTGISPIHIYDLIGRVLIKNVTENTQIKYKDFE